MAVGTRFAGAASLAGAALAAMALTGVAVFTVQAATCEDAGHYVEVDGQTTLVGGCLEPEDLPAAPTTRDTEPQTPDQGVDRLRQSP
ncbi:MULTISPECIES: hypothetical protein [Actinokineospora]|uniref:Secreted protein n=1 Tax=Actinokineospora fastidiosa TaxID=1816 RepID=A0A918G305_9PSEU|nr:MULTISPECIES: hypothetical protein [Actinokineospora]UVS77016.1 hypothetical protein Actkin_00716 [Actinokineospora sp. UTMC 2448]GGS14111.1 hypothetical protein GCM10010171_02460 [Actinokineospora fastidiosa]